MNYFIVFIVKTIFYTITADIDVIIFICSNFKEKNLICLIF